MGLQDHIGEQEPIEHRTYPIVKRGRYHNPHIKDIKRNIWDVILWQMGHFHTEEDLSKLVQPPYGFQYPNPKFEVASHLPRVTWVNHSTFYLELEGMGILTDPVFYKCCSPIWNIGPKRLHDISVSIEDIQKLDLILISHNHYDHVDKEAIKKLLKRFPEVIVCVPTGVSSWVKKLGVKSVIELSWWEDETIRLSKHENISIHLTSVPSQHFSGRGLFDKNKTLWCGWVLEISQGEAIQKKFYFVGDTGYNTHDFKDIGNCFGGVDLSLIPIGTYIPKRFMSPVHIGPEEAVQIHQEVRSILSVGMHWRTFKLSSEPILRPPYDLYDEMKKHQLDPLSFRVLEPGQTINW